MGADGGVLVLLGGLNEPERELLGPWLSGLANGHSRAAEHGADPLGIGEIVGYYGTDCEFDLYDAWYLAREILSGHEEEPAEWDLTWPELLLDLATLPTRRRHRWDPKGSLLELAYYVFGDDLAQPRPVPPDIEVVEWARRTLKALCGLEAVETWT